MKKLIPVLMIIFCVGLTAQNTEVSKDFEGRVITKVIKLKHITLSGAYVRAIYKLLENDYEPQKTDVQYDSQDNVAIVTATPLTLEKVENFINKIDIPKESLTFSIFLIEADNSKAFKTKLKKYVLNELEKIDITGGRILSKPRVSTILGEKVAIKSGSKDGEWFNIEFTPTGSPDSLLLDNLNISRFYKDQQRDEQGKEVWVEWNLLKTTLKLSKEKAAVISVSEEEQSQLVLVIALVD